MTGRVLLTGASGLLGASICRALLADGWLVTGTWKSNQPLLQHPNLTYRLIDLQHPEELALLGAGFDAVVHNAARIPGAGLDDAGSAAANRLIDDGLLRHLAAAGFAGRFIFISSAYIRYPGLLSASRYLKEKQSSEAAFAAAFPHSCSLRISSPYGPALRHRNVLSIFLQQALRGEALSLYGSGSRSQDFIHADDVAAAVNAALQQPAAELPPVLTVASGEPFSMRDLARLVIRLVPGCTSQTVSSGTPDPQEDFRAEFPVAATAAALRWAPRISLEAGLRAWIGSL